MFDDGFTNLTCIDFCGPVIKYMAQRNRHRRQMDFLTMDARKLDFPAQSFDMVLDKGTLDSIACSECAAADIFTTLREVHRVLKPGGVYILVTHSDPQTRMPLLVSPALRWRVTYVNIEHGKEEGEREGEGGAGHFFFICQKQAQ
ncbi:hypothetical protein KIPB_002279 [Kipferlia bialata]|uniref:Methyltransferase type 11 domain-containing protein n=1 Tax=Kipferlia bialata TaxID=797122 RepID=A0A9K3CTJ9_9EUKA|nr:hypothetical protein KIPB_002279 [Kipferlia bialata]|eukprot:g2279.t1